MTQLVELAGVQLAAQLPAYPVRVIGSDRALVRVLSNLVANAIAHTPEGGRVELTLGRDADGDYWFVSRADAMLKSSGYRISPTEIEDLAFASGQLAEVVAFV